MFTSNTHFWIYEIIAAAILLAAHLVGVFLKLYKNNNWFDLVTHFCSGFFILTPLGFWIAYRQPDSALWFAALFSFCFGCAVIVLWEVLEFAIDAIFKTDLQKWKEGKKHHRQGSGVIDIMGDIIANLVGSLLALGILCILAQFFAM